MNDKPIKVKILKQTVAKKKTVRPGDVIELEPNDARFLIHRGKAEEHKPKPAKE